MLAQALRLYRISFVRCLPLAVVGALLVAWAGAYASAQVAAVEGQLTALADTAVVAPENVLADLSQMDAALHSLWHSPAVWASYLAALLLGLAFHGALIVRQATIADERGPQQGGTGAPAGPRGHWLSRTLHQLPSLLAVVGLFALVAACVAVLLAALANSPSLGLLVGLLLLIVATWLWGQLQLWLVAMFAQELSAVAALRASWNLVSGQWWRVSTLITAPYIAVALVSSAVQLLASGGPSALSPAPSATLLDQVASVAGGALTLPMLPAAWLAIYWELSERREREGRNARPKKTPQARG